MAVQSSGNCYLCGKSAKKGSMKTHLLKTHNEGAEECWLIKVEFKYNKNYWLYLEVAKKAKLQDLDDFLRDIWLECCGHMSAFFEQRYEEYSMSTKLSSFEQGDTLEHHYDFGSTTELLITFTDTIHRPKQKEAVKLVGRNEPPTFECHKCHKPATQMDMELAWETNECFVCNKHATEEECLPITNSPRMGVCGYDESPEKYDFIQPEVQKKAATAKTKKQEKPQAKNQDKVIKFPQKPVAKSEKYEKLVKEGGEIFRRLDEYLDAIFTLTDEDEKAMLVFMSHLTLAGSLEDLELDAAALASKIEPLARKFEQNFADFADYFED